MDDITEISVLGAGVMGHGIAQVFARAGFSVVLYDGCSLLWPADDKR